MTDTGRSPRWQSGWMPPLRLDQASDRPNFLVIDPDECIDCDVCVPECPVNAIYPEEEVPADQQDFIALNAELARIWPMIDQKKDPPPDAEEWVGVPNKLQYLKR